MANGIHHSARIALGTIRLVNGALGLFLPRVLIGRIDPAGSPGAAATYAFRLFGVRTILLGRALLTGDPAARDRALAEAPLIHAADTATATLLALTGRVTRRSGGLLIAVSAVNTMLALVARRGLRRTTVGA